ncbi:MAG: cytochrome c [Saprospiraceae bacterium]|nr:cytochrome c [Saprospiraceae bacterium]MBP7699611.1 cytochrome c [Saprospiraceae bacterium]
MKNYIVIIFALCSIFVVIACADNSQNNTFNSDGSNAANVLDGSRIFQKNCTACHGATGTLGMNGAKDLTQSNLSIDERIQIITNGKKLMTPFKGMLTPEEIEAVALYTESFK